MKTLKQEALYQQKVLEVLNPLLDKEEGLTEGGKDILRKAFTQGADVTTF